MIVAIRVTFEVDVPETQVDCALSRVGPALPLLCSDRELCIEPVICRRADLYALPRQQLERQVRLSVRAFRQRGHLLPIGIVARLSPAHIAKSYLRYAAFQWLDTAGQGGLKVDRLREVLRVAVAFALQDWLDLDLSVWFGDAQNYVAIPRN